MKPNLALALACAATAFGQPTLIPFAPDTTHDYTPTLSWNAVAGVTYYRVQVDDAADFASPLVTSLVTGATTFTLNPMSPGRKWWHVSSEQAFDTYSAPDDFFISPQPTLIAYAPDPTPARRPGLRWNRVEGATAYKIEIDDEAGFGSPIVSQTLQNVSSYIPGQDLPAGDVYWRVSSNYDFGDFSAPDKITIDPDLPFMPVLRPFVPDTTDDNTPTLTWNAVPGATDYYIEVADAADFASPFISTRVTGATSFTPSYLMAPGRKWWHVSSDREFHAYSSPDDFYVAPAPVLIPYAPDPTSSRRPVFRWNPVHSATGYKIEIDDQQDFASPLVSQQVGMRHDFEPAEDLPAGNIWWRVSSNYDFAWFTPADRLTINPNLAMAPALIPIVPDTTHDKTPTFSWNPVAGAGNYWIEVDDAADFATPLVSTFVTAGTSITLQGELIPGRKWWHVSSDLDFNSYSSPDDFYVTPAPELKPVIPEPTPTQRPVFRWNHVRNATDYRIEIDDQQDIASPLVSQQVSNREEFLPAVDLPAGDIWWRVSSNYDFAWFSPSRKLTIDTNIAFAPALIPMRDTIDDNTPTLSWSPVDGARDYWIQVDDAPDFASPLVSSYVTAATSFTTSPLSPGRKYWHVSSQKDMAIYSRTNNFLLAPYPERTAPGPNPTRSRRPTFGWKSVVGASGYLVEIAGQAGFGAPLIAEQVGNVLTYQPAQDLPEGDIFWRVGSSVDYGFLSPAERFIIDTASAANARASVPSRRLALGNRTLSIPEGASRAIVRVFTIGGRLIYQSELDLARSSTLDDSSLRAGAYILQVAWMNPAGKTLDRTRFKHAHFRF